MDRFKVNKVEADPNAKSPGITSKAINLMKQASKNNASENDQSRKFSLAQLTREALPRLDHYRISKRTKKRPSIGELQGEAVEQGQEPNAEPELPEKGGHVEIKLGWIVGVMIPCLLNIWGVMLFLRLSWVVGQSGIIQSLVIIAISALVCVITTLSLSAISTNGEVKGGGVYFIISRSLGPEFGASIGVVFAFANAVAASMNTIGFCDSLNDLLRTNGLKIVDGGINDVRIVGCCTILVLILVCCVGMEWESKAQNFLIATIVVAIINFLVGAAVGPQGDEDRIAHGFVGFRTDTFEENMGPDYRFSENVHQSFFSVFAIFFPSVTGIQAGANISGDLKDPAEAIPKGTLLALGISMLSYAIFVVFAGGSAVRDASGNITDLINGTLVGVDMSCKIDHSCEYGLQNSYSIMQLMSLWGPLIYAGCFAATLSTALTNLLSVPRLIQALGTDRIYPGLIFFSKPYGKHGEPYRGYVLTFLISSGFLLIGQLNVIAPLITTFYLASYALINFCTFHAAFIKPLGWRPTFKYYNSWLSLFGFILCVSIMFMIEWVSSLITLVIIFALYLVVMYRKPDVNWGSSTQAQTYKTALGAAHRLQTVSDHVKNYNPQILVLAGDPYTRPPLVDLANLITKHHSLMVVGNVIPVKVGYKARMSLLKEGQKYLAAKKIKSFYNIIDGLSFQDGVNALIKTTGFGKMSPNIVLMGYKSDWQTCNRDEVTAYFNILHTSFSCRMGVTILRIPNGLDFSHLHSEIKTPNSIGTPNGISTPNGNASVLNFQNEQQHFDARGLTVPKTAGLFHVDSNLNLHDMGNSTASLSLPQSPTSPITKSKHLKVMSSSDSVVYSTQGGSEPPPKVLDALTVFTRKQPKGAIIDVWWLYDDGGLTMLLPYIISMRANWSHCKLRVFALANRPNELELEERNMANMLAKFRINYSTLKMLQGVTDRPQQSTIEKHQRIIQGFQEGSHPECFISTHELESLEEKTNRQLRLHELIVENSSDASLIVMSLPMPRKEAISAPLYMSWLEMLTSDVNCPILLSRGNQFPVLTFYS